MSERKDKVLKIRVDQEFLDWLDEAAANAGVTRSEAVREMLVEIVQIRRAIKEFIGGDYPGVEQMLRSDLVSPFVYELLLEGLVLEERHPAFSDWARWGVETAKRHDVAGQLLGKYKTGSETLRKWTRALFEGSEQGRARIREIVRGNWMSVDFPDIDELKQWDVWSEEDDR